MKKTLFFLMLLFGFTPTILLATTEDVTRSVWANEAIVATYTYSFQNYLQRQQEIAKYFTASAWIEYGKAFAQSKIPAIVQKESYTVSAVATSTPRIKQLNRDYWQAKMDLLVEYRGPKNEQKQQLGITLIFMKAPPGQGVRGYAIASLQAVETTPMCVCQPALESTSEVHHEQMQKSKPDNKN